MQIKKDTWHAKVYQWWKRARFGSYANDPPKDIPLWDYALREYNRKTLNLCHYMRVVLIFAPIRWLFQGTINTKKRRIPVPAFWVPPLLVVAWFVLYAYKPRAALDLLLALGITVATIIGLLGAAYLVIEHLAPWLRKKADAYWERPEKEREPKEPNIVVEYIKAKKSKICPLIEIVDDTPAKPVKASFDEPPF